MRRHSRHAALLVLVAALAACGPSEEERRAAAEAQAAPDLAAYRELVAAESWEQALEAGRVLARKHQGTQAAAEAQAALADLVGKVAAVAEDRRLAGLWSYQTNVQAGAQETSASIYSSVPAAGSDRIRLILRRHAAWGQSVYLYGHGDGFACPAPCTLALRYDGASAERVKASLPPTGEPAIFIEDAAAFLARLPDVERLAVDATLVGGGPLTIEFEVGGYDPARFATLPGEGPITRKE